jgi:hypothetical protein
MCEHVVVDSEEDLRAQIAEIKASIRGWSVLDSLRRRERALEEELKRLRARIERLEADDAASGQQ